VRSLVSTLLAAQLLFGASVASAQDPTAGKAAFSQCAVCHSQTPGVEGVGPSLAGIVGRKVGKEANFTYSSGLARSDKVWTETAIDQFLSDPSAVYPGTRMTMKITQPKMRADIIAYLLAASRPQH
jgi:cytochrome c